MRLFLALACALLLTSPPCLAGDTINTIRSRGVVRCGVARDIPGFAVKDAAGNWSGFEVDLCRAVAAAVLGSPDKASFLPLDTTARFTALLAREVDLLSRDTTWTLSREAMLGVDFAGPVLFTGLAFLVPARNAPSGIQGLAGAKVATARGGTHVQNIADMAVSHGLSFQVELYDSIEQARDALYKGECQALAADGVLLYSFKATAPGGPDAYVVLPGRFSKEIISPAVLASDPQWSLTVRCVLAALITAEQCGLTRQGALDASGPAADPGCALFLKHADELSKPLGLTPGWALRAVQAVGNYGEMFERNLGMGSPLKIDRGLNRLWSQGGLLYAPAF